MWLLISKNVVRIASRINIFLSLLDWHSIRRARRVGVFQTLFNTSPSVQVSPIARVLSEELTHEIVKLFYFTSGVRSLYFAKTVHRVQWKPNAVATRCLESSPNSCRKNIREIGPSSWAESETINVFF